LIWHAPGGESVVRGSGVSEKGSFTFAYPLRRPTMAKKKTSTTIKVTDLPKKAVSEEEMKKVKGGISSEPVYRTRKLK
jgi:hypothetical protein